MRLNEPVDAVEIIDACRVFDIGTLGVLMALAEAHQRLVCPGIIVEHGDLDDQRRDHWLGLPGGRIQPFQLCEHVIGLDQVRIELDVVGGVGRADLGNALDLGVAHRIGDGEALEEALERYARCRRRKIEFAWGRGLLVLTLRTIWQLRVIGMVGAGSATTASLGTEAIAARLAAWDASHGSSQAVWKRPAWTSASRASA